MSHVIEESLTILYTLSTSIIIENQESGMVKCDLSNSQLQLQLELELEPQLLVLRIN